MSGENRVLLYFLRATFSRTVGREWHDHSINDASY